MVFHYQTLSNHVIMFTTCLSDVYSMLSWCGDTGGGGRAAFDFFEFMLVFGGVFFNVLE